MYLYEEMRLFYGGIIYVKNFITHNINTNDWRVMVNSIVDSIFTKRTR